MCGSEHHNFASFPDRRATGLIGLFFQELLCHVPRSRLTSRNANTSFKIYEGLDTRKICSYRSCDFIKFISFNQLDNNKNVNVFHLRELIVSLSTYVTTLVHKVLFVVVMSLLVVVLLVFIYPPH